VLWSMALKVSLTHAFWCNSGGCSLKGAAGYLWDREAAGAAWRSKSAAGSRGLAVHGLEKVIDPRYLVEPHALWAHVVCGPCFRRTQRGLWLSLSMALKCRGTCTLVARWRVLPGRCGRIVCGVVCLLVLLGGTTRRLAASDLQRMALQV
jgi:hypothetical protein